MLISTAVGLAVTTRWQPCCGVVIVETEARMPGVVDRDTVVGLVADGAQLAEVLPRDEYDEEHLPAALHVPLKQLTTAIAELDRARPVVVYCWDGL